MHRHFILCALLVAFVLIGAAQPARADWYASGGGGVFAPWKGNVGASAFAQLLWAPESRLSRWGLEFEYRSYDFDGERFDEDDPHFDTYALRFIGEWHPYPDMRFSPYLGAGLSIMLFKYTAFVPFFSKEYSEDRFGIGGVGIAGVEAKLFDALPVALFAEGRFNLDYALYYRVNDDGDALRSWSIGGFSGWLGLRVRF
jgi:opacity protein-like surface antigen